MTQELLDLGGRLGPVLLFLVAMTIVAEVADIAGVFDVAGHWTARAGRHRTWVLWLLVAGLATATTIVLSLDTTVVLLTPVVIAIARQLRLPAMPLALTIVWLANTASLLLPVSNLSNLLALHRFQSLGLSLHDYVALAWAPALAAIGATLLLLFTLHHRTLLMRYELDAPADPHDRTLLRISGAVCIALGPAFLTGVNPAVPSSIAAVVLLLTLALRSREHLWNVRVPWVMVISVGALFVVVDLLMRHGLEPALAALVGSGQSPADLWRVGATGMLGANAVNNLPAYLALEPVADDSPARLMALLIGVNVGPMVTLWGSLATLLWRDRCRRAGLSIDTGAFMLRSALCATLAVAAALAALSVVNPG